MTTRASSWFPLHCCRFQGLREPLQERRAALEAQRLLLQFFRDADEEMAWVQEKLPLATAQDYGQSLSAVQHLQQKHQVSASTGRLGGGGAAQKGARLIAKEVEL
jgi:hypothetical protein